MCTVAYFTEVTKSRSLPRRAEWEDDTCSDEQGDIGAMEKMQGIGGLEDRCRDSDQETHLSRTGREAADSVRDCFSN